MTRPAVRRAAVPLLAVALALPALAQSTARAPGEHVSLPSTAFDVGTKQAELAAQAAARDPSGRAGSGQPAVRHHSNGRDARRAAASTRMHRTGWVGLEPTLGVLRDGWVYVTAMGVTDAVARNLYRTVVLRTRDGARFEDVSPALAGGPSHPVTQDEYLYGEPRTGRVFLADFVGCGEISSTGDGGRTWTPPGMSCSNLADHQNLFGGRPVSSALQGDYPEVLYYCASTLVALEGYSTSAGCTKSLDGGTTWLPTGGPAWTPTPYTPDEGEPQGLCNGLIGHGTTGPDGTVYLPKNCDTPNVLVSRDEGVSWERRPVPTSVGVTRGPIGFPDHEAAVAVDARGTVYLGWIGRNRKPYLATSRDRGLHWSRARDVAPPGVNETAQPALAVTPGGRVAFSYMGTTTSPGRPFPDDSSCPLYSIRCMDVSARYKDTRWTAYVTVSDDATSADPWFTSAPLTDAVPEPLTRGECEPLRCQQQYDFGDVQLGPDGTPWLARIDGCTTETRCTSLGELVLGRLVGLPRHG